jgi:hypothetical protein
MAYWSIPSVTRVRKRTRPAIHFDRSLVKGRLVLRRSHWDIVVSAVLER